MRKPKSKRTAFWLCLFLGYFGAHRFYVGKIGTGILYLCTAGIGCFGWFLDLLMIALGRFRDKDNNQLSSGIDSPKLSVQSENQQQISSPEAAKNYVVFDIETTGFSRTTDRIIEIAANEYSNGRLHNHFHSFVNPGCHIPMSITQLTGISDADVADAPSISQVSTDFLSFIGSKPLVGHNIRAFDIPFLESQMDIQIHNAVHDTLVLSKKAFPDLPSYKLSFLDQALRLGLLQHHRADNDILVTNALFLACQTPEKYLHYLKDKEAISKIPTEERRYLHSRVDIHSISKSNPNAIAHTNLSGKTVCFTGDISIPRERAYQLAVDAGAILKSHVSKKLDYLVVGEQDARVVGDTGMSHAQVYAKRLISEGEAHLKVINETEFFELLREISV